MKNKGNLSVLEEDSENMLSFYVMSVLWYVHGEALTLETCTDKHVLWES